MERNPITEEAEQQLLRAARGAKRPSGGWRPTRKQVIATVALTAAGVPVVTQVTLVPPAAASSMGVSSIALASLNAAQVTDQDVRDAIVAFAESQIGKYPDYLAETGGATSSYEENCADFATEAVHAGYQAYNLDSPLHGGETYNRPYWSMSRALNTQNDGITSVEQSGENAGRLHNNDGTYKPPPGDIVLFAWKGGGEHAGVVQKVRGNTLFTVESDTAGDTKYTTKINTYPNYQQDGEIKFFVDTGVHASNGSGPVASPSKQPAPVSSATASGTSSSAASSSSSDGTPGITAAAPVASLAGGAQAVQASPVASSSAPPNSVVPGLVADAPTASTSGSDAVKAAGDQPAEVLVVPTQPSVQGAPASSTATGKPTYTRHIHTVPVQAVGSAQIRAFINQVAPGAVAAQLRFGVPAAVTISQALDESANGTSKLAWHDKNLFGIKGMGPAGTVQYPTQEFENGQWVTKLQWFRRYNNIAESIADHAKLLKYSGYYTAAMAHTDDPDLFAQYLTGIYATNPSYGKDLITRMREYNLYRYDHVASSGAVPSAQPSPVASAPSSVVTSSASAQAAAGSVPGLAVAAPVAQIAQPAQAAPVASATTSPSGTASQVAPDIPGVSGSASGSGTTASGASQAPTSSPSPSSVQASPIASVPGVPDSAPAAQVAPSATASVAPTRVASSSVPPVSQVPVAPSSGATSAPAASPSTVSPSPSISSAIRAAHSAVRARVRKPAATRTPTTDEPEDTSAKITPDGAQASPVDANATTTAALVQQISPDASSIVLPQTTTILKHEELFIRVAGKARWQVLAAIYARQTDGGDPSLSPMGGKLNLYGSHGEKLSWNQAVEGALRESWAHAISLAETVYHVDLGGDTVLSEDQVAQVFAAYNRGNLLKVAKPTMTPHQDPYVVNGLRHGSMTEFPMTWPEVWFESTRGGCKDRYPGAMLYYLLLGGNISPPTVVSV